MKRFVPWKRLCSLIAAECQRAADEMSDPNAKELMLYVASRWLALAKADERRAALLADPFNRGEPDSSSE
jgi:hypothetical protein